jgi:ferredoxin
MKYHWEWIFNKKGPETNMFEKMKQQIKTRRGQLQIDREKCMNCVMCWRRCPVAAITVNRPTKAWIVDDNKCVRCGHCVHVCPNRALSLVKNI